MLDQEIPMATEGIQLNSPEKPDMDLTLHFFLIQSSNILIFFAQTDMDFCMYIHSISSLSESLTLANFCFKTIRKKKKTGFSS